MWLSSILKSLSPGSPHTRTRRRRLPRQRPPARRLTLEALEDRSLPSCMVSLAPNEAAPQLVGEGITWTAIATDCGAGDSPSWRNTNTLPVVPEKSTNFFVAGMLPSTTYEMRHVFSDGTGSAPMFFATGALPTTLTFPSFTVIQPPGPGSDVDQDMLFQGLSASPNNAPNPFATDLQGRVVWYYDVSQSGLTRTYPVQNL